MSRTRIKICGVRRVEDALMAARLGADAIGMVFHEPAFRYCRPEIAREIVARLPPPVTGVGLFMNDGLTRIREVVAMTGIRCIQLHGEESPQDVAALAPLQVIKTLRLDRADPAAALAPWRTSRPTNVVAILLETPGSAGGSGEENDWPLIRRALDARLLDSLPPLVVAGGLRPTNVASVVTLLRPWAVDVSSGVEEVKGQKSPTLVEAFICAVRDANAGQPAAAPALGFLSQR
jgi:phosphoribosylanthranilate isomerase